MSAKCTMRSVEQACEQKQHKLGSTGCMGIIPRSHGNRSHAFLSVGGIDPFLCAEVGSTEAISVLVDCVCMCALLN